MTFFTEQITTTGSELVLDEETSRHMIQVLRMSQDEQVVLTDGQGNSAIATIVKPHKKHCTVNIISTQFIEREMPALTIAISLTKNTNRFEWFIEKAAELGTAEIIPMICERTEKQHSRLERFVSICKSAMLQSSQVWLTKISEPAKFKDVVAGAVQEKKYVGHLLKEFKHSLVSAFDASVNSHIILIGPEGDLTQAEVDLALDKKFIPVSMGKTTLRVETAGIYAAAICRKS